MGTSHTNHRSEREIGVGPCDMPFGHGALARSDIARRTCVDGRNQDMHMHAHSAPPRYPDMSGILKRGRRSGRVKRRKVLSWRRTFGASDGPVLVPGLSRVRSPEHRRRTAGKMLRSATTPIVGEAWGVADRKGRVCAGNVTGRIRAPSHAGWGKAKTQREARKADPWHGRRAARSEHGCAGLWLAWLGGRRRRSGHRLIQSRRRGASCEVS